MRRTLRNVSNKKYWEQRWESIELDQPMENRDIYPLKYALLAVKSNRDRILEVGCGAGRILKWFHYNGYSIAGVDFVEAVTKRLKSENPELTVSQADVLDLPFASQSFDVLLAFGVLHNLEIDACKHAMSEISKVLSVNGRVCISFRADNCQNKLLDWYKNRRTGQSESKVFHKLNLTKKEFSNLFISGGFVIEEVHAVSNMPFLYQFPFFRSKQHMRFDETTGRREGYRLNRLGNILHRSLMWFIPNQWCNVYIIIAKKQNI